MTSTRRESGVGLRWMHVDRGRGVQPHVDVHTENYCVLMQRSWRLFYQNFIFGQKKVEIFLRYKLVI